MGYISEYVQIEESTSDSGKVKFFGEEREWIDVADLNAWIAAFWDACRDIAAEVGGDSASIESEAFLRTT